MAHYNHRGSDAQEDVVCNINGEYRLLSFFEAFDCA